MRMLIQKVTEASVTIEGKLKSAIGKGLLVLVGVEDRDTEADIDWLAGKLVNIRIFDDENGVMNKSVMDENGEILVVSQFTLQAQTKKGNRPSYIKASKPEFAKPMYEKFCAKVSELLGKEVKTGQFQAYMEVKLVNDGPTTIWIDSQNRE
jgi:D-aminoacyl-tRNA deacylase